MPRIRLNQCPNCKTYELSGADCTCCPNCNAIVENGIVIGEFSDGNIIYFTKDNINPPTIQESKLRKYLAIMDLEQKALVLQFIERNFKL